MATLGPDGGGACEVLEEGESFDIGRLTALQALYVQDAGADVLSVREFLKRKDMECQNVINIAAPEDLLLDVDSLMDGDSLSFREALGAELTALVDQYGSSLVICGNASSVLLKIVFGICREMRIKTLGVGLPSAADDFLEKMTMIAFVEAQKDVDSALKELADRRIDIRVHDQKQSDAEHAPRAYSRIEFVDAF